MRFESKVAIVTGAAQGMGAQHARRFMAEGGSVVIADVNAVAGHAIASELGERAFFSDLDVTDETAWIRTVNAAEDRFGRLTTLINNAGIIGPVIAADQLALADYEKVCAINQTGVFLGIKHAIPAMLRGGGGAIVNVSSISGIVAIYGTPNVAYAASKFAVRGMTKQAAMEYGKKNIRVNSVHPGYIRTPMMTEALDEEGIRVAGGSVPVGRVGEPDDVSSLVLYLASDEAGFITGAEYIIDGGLTAQ